MTNAIQAEKRKKRTLSTGYVEVLAPTASIPMGMVRSELFSASLSGPMVDRKDVSAERDLLGISIKYSGPHLNQEHFKAWQAAIHLARLNNAMSGVEFTVPASEMLRCMGKTYRDHNQRKVLWGLLEDLQKASVSMSTNRSRYIGSLVFSAAQDKITGQICIRLNPDLAQLLSNEVLENDMMRMMELGRDQLAIWLHNYYASHLTPRPMLVKELQRMCGTTLDLRRFRYRLKKCLTLLMGGIRPLITKFTIGADDLVRVEKTSTNVLFLSNEVIERKHSSKKSSSAAQAARNARINVAL